MEVEGPKSSLGYGKPPWIFKGRALYQLHLVKAETARALIPKEFRLVEALGYTLGGFFLASYDESPAGRFDELVVIAGTLWNPPTSCAWAAKVLVNSDLACDHGRKDVGLPSQVAKFSKRIAPVQKQELNKASRRFLSLIGMGGSGSDLTTNQMDILVSEMNNPIPTVKDDTCNVNLTSFVPASKVSDNAWKGGPAIKMYLPSFSGRTEYNHNLLKYSCRIECRVRAVRPVKVSEPPHAPNKKAEGGGGGEAMENQRKSHSLSVMLSKPILALEFSCLEMQVEAPIIVISPTGANSNGSSLSFS